MTSSNWSARTAVSTNGINCAKDDCSLATFEWAPIGMPCGPSYEEGRGTSVGASNHEMPVG